MGALTLEDVLAAVRWVAREEAAGGSGDAACAALLARAETAAAHRRRTGRAHPDYGDGSIAAAALSLRRGEGAGGGRRDLLSAGAVVCRMLAERRRSARGSCVDESVIGK